MRGDGGSGITLICVPVIIIIFCAAFLREYSYICSRYGFTSFYAMWSPGIAFEIIRFEGLPQFKWSDLGKRDVVGQGSFRAVFMVFNSSG